MAGNKINSDFEVFPSMNERKVRIRTVYQKPSPGMGHPAQTINSPADRVKLFIQQKLPFVCFRIFFDSPVTALQQFTEITFQKNIIDHLSQ